MPAVPHGLLLVDKPPGMTSHDIVSRVRRLLGTKKVGHAGTLDPAAEGLVVVAAGAATRLLPYLGDTTKEYVAHIVLGCSTDTADVEGTVIRGNWFTGICRADDVQRALHRQLGTIDQLPPAHSAIKLAGQPLHRRVRRGEQVDVPLRTVTIYAIELLDFAFPDCIVRLTCSSGTYVRSIARDFGEVLGTGAYLHHLLRTQVGPFDLMRSWTMAEIERSLSIHTWTTFGLHPDVVTADCPALILDRNDERAWYDGRPIANSPAVQSSIVKRAQAFDADGGWVGLAEREDIDSGWRPKLVVARANHEKARSSSDA